MKAKEILATIGRYAVIVWSVPAVKSVILTRLIQAGIGASGAGIVVAVVDALASK